MNSLKLIIRITSVVCLFAPGKMAREYENDYVIIGSEYGSGDGQQVYCKGNPLSEVEFGEWACQSDDIDLGAVDGPVMVGAMCKLRCDHRHSIEGGRYQAICTQQGWQHHPDLNENPPACLSHPKACEELPEKANGVWKCESGEDVESRVCTVSCAPFYDHYDGGTTACAKSGWFPDPADISCITCKAPPPPTHGSWNCNNFGNIVEYKHTLRVCAAYCDSGFTNTGNNMTLCSMTGRDTFIPDPQLSVCQPACPDLPAAVKNGTWSCQQERPPFVGECSLTCNDGTTLIGDGVVSCELGPIWSEDDSCAFPLNISVSNQLGGMLVSVIINGRIYYQSMTDSSGHVQLYSPHGEAVIKGELDGFQMEPINITVGGEGVQETINISASPACLGLPPVVKNGTWMCEDKEAPYANNCSLTCDNGSTLIGDGITVCGLGSVWIGQDNKCIFSLSVSIANAIDKSHLNGMMVSLTANGEIYNKSITNSSGHVQLFSPHGEVVIKGELDGFQMDPITITVGVEEVQETINISASPACLSLPALVKNGTWMCEDKEAPYANECSLTCDNGAALIGDGITSCGLGSVWTGQDDKCLFSLTVSIANAIDKNQLNGMAVSLMVDGEIYSQSNTDSSGHVQLYSPHGEVVIKGEREGFQMDPITITVGVEEVQETINISASPACSSLPALVKNGTWTCEDKEAPYANNCSLICDNGATLIGDGITVCGLESVWTGQDDKCIFSLTVSIANAIDKNQLNGMVVSLTADGEIYNKSITDSSGHVQLYSPHGEVVIKGELDGFQMEPMTITVGVEEVQETINISALPACLSLPALVKNGTWTCEDKETPYANECSLTCDKGATLIGDGITSCGLGSVWTGQDDKCLFSLTVSMRNAIYKNQLNGMVVSLMVDGEIYSQSNIESSGHVQLYSPHGEVVIKGEREGFQMDPITITVGEEEVQETINISASPACLSLPSLVKNGTWTCEDKEAPYANECSLTCDKGATLLGDGITSCGLGSVWTGQDDKCLFSLTVSMRNAIYKNQLNGMVVSLMVDGEIYSQSNIDSSGHVQLYSPHGEVVIKGEQDGFQMDPITIAVGVEEVQETINISASPACPSLPALVKNGTWTCEDKEAPYANNCSLTCDNGATLIGDGIVSCGVTQVWTGQDEKCLFLLTISISNSIDNNQLSYVVVSLKVDGEIYSQSNTDSSGHVQLYSPHGEVVIKGELDGFQMDPIAITVGVEEVQETINILASPACPSLPAFVKNGNWTCEEKEAPYANNCNLRCDSGLTLIGDGVAFCGLGQIWTDEDDKCIFSLTISTANAVNNSMLGGMLVFLMVDGQVYDQSQTNSSGYARLDSPHGAVTITGEMDGWRMAPIDITVGTEQSQRTIEAFALPEGVSILTISTANAINNHQVGGMLVSLHAQNQLYSQATTNTTGYATLASPHGEVVITGDLDGFQMAPIRMRVDDEVSSSNVKISASPETSEPARVVMNWGRLPMDLDLHVRQVSGRSTVCHCYYGNMQCGGVGLDIDNTSGGQNGAETMTWTRVAPGNQYVVYVYDYSGSSTHLTASAARLAIYTSGKQPMQFNVPTRRGGSRYWLVGCFNSDGRNGFSVINQLRTSEPTHC